MDLGPYRFSARDVQRLGNDAGAVWELLQEGRDPGALEALRGAFEAPIDFAEYWAAWLGAGEHLARTGQLPASATGQVAALHVSTGGVPKRPVEQLDVGFGGALGDRQATRRHHGSPAQALCLWSSEVIETLRAEGHPLVPGAAGENVTISGLPWAEVRAGVRLRLGTVRCQVMSPATPCKQLVRLFRGGEFQRIDHRRGSVARVYAAVLEPGRIHRGDAAVLEP